MIKVFGVNIGNSSGWDEIDSETHVFYEVEPSNAIKSSIPSEFRDVEKFAFITVSYTYGEIYFTVDVEAEDVSFTLQSTVIFSPKK